MVWDREPQPRSHSADRGFRRVRRRGGRVFELRRSPSRSSLGARSRAGSRLVPGRTAALPPGTGGRSWARSTRAAPYAPCRLPSALWAAARAWEWALGVDGPTLRVRIRVLAPLGVRPWGRGGRDQGQSPFAQRLLRVGPRDIFALVIQTAVLCDMQTL